MKTMKLKVVRAWNDYREIVAYVISAVLVAVMVICLMVNSGVAQRLAEYSDVIYVITAVWFAIIAVKRNGVVFISTGGKHIKKGD